MAGCVAQSIHSATWDGSDGTIVWSVSSTSGPTPVITAGQGTSTVTVETDGTTDAVFDLTATVTGSAGPVPKTVQVTHTHTEESTGPAFYALTPDETTFEMLGVKVGTGGLTTTHTADLYAPDFEGVYRIFPDNTPVWSSGRVVRNRVIYSEDFTNAAWTKDTNASMSGSPGNQTYTLAANTARGVLQNFGAPSANYVCSIEITPLVDTEITLVLVTPRLVKSVTVAGGRIRLVTDPVSHQSGDFYFYDSSGGIGDRFIVHNVQIEQVSGATDETLPGEYVKTEASRAQKVFANQNGNTVTSNVVTEAVGAPLSSTPYLQYYPAAQNDCKYSSNLVPTGGGDNVWNSGAGSAAATYDQIGLTGEPNTASLVTDNDAGASESAFQYSAVDATGDPPLTAVVYIKKDTNQSRFPAIQIWASISASPRAFYYFNTETGELTLRPGVSGGGTPSAESILIGDWWKVMVSMTGYTGGTSAGRIYIAPAGTSSLADPDTPVHTTGSIIVGNAETHKKTIAEVRGLGPIFTTTAAVATDYILYQMPIANWASPNAHYAEFDISANAVAASYVACGTVNNQHEIWEANSATRVATYPGNSNITGLTLTNIDKMGAIQMLGGSNPYINVDGVWGTTIAGNNAAGSTAYYIGSRGAGFNASAISFGVRELQRYDITTYQEGADLIDALMAQGAFLLTEDGRVVTTEDDTPLST